MNKAKPLFKVYCASDELCEQFQLEAIKHGIVWSWQRARNGTEVPCSLYCHYLVVIRGYDNKLWLNWMTDRDFFKTETDMLYVTAEQFIDQADRLLVMTNV